MRSARDLPGTVCVYGGRRHEVSQNEDDLWTEHAADGMVEHVSAVLHD